MLRTISLAEHSSRASVTENGDRRGGAMPGGFYGTVPTMADAGVGGAYVVRIRDSWRSTLASIKGK